ELPQLLIRRPRFMRLSQRAPEALARLLMRCLPSPEAPVLGLAHDLDLRMQAQQRAQKHARPLMIVADDKAGTSVRAARLHFGPHNIPFLAKSYLGDRPNLNLNARARGGGIRAVAVRRS